MADDDVDGVSDADAGARVRLRWLRPGWPAASVGRETARVVQRVVEQRALAELAQTTELLERTGALAHVGGWQVNLETMKLSWTAETFRIAEVEPPDEPPLEDGIGLFAPEAQPIIAAAVQAAIDHGTPYDLELPLITAKGRHRWVQTQGFAEQRDGRSVRLYGTFQDITERRLAHTALMESEARTRHLLHVTNIGLWDWDLRTNEVYFSPEWKRMLGHTDADLPNTFESWTSRLHPDDLQPTLAAADRYRRGEQSSYDVSFRMRRRDGSWVWIRAIGELECDERGTPVRMMGSHTDITHARALQEQSEALQRRLLENQKLEAVGRLAGGVAHDFNNMLSAILGYAGLAMEHVGPDHPAWSDLAQIRSAAERSAGLTRQLLAYARRQPVRPQLVDLDEHVDNMLAMLRRIIGENIEMVRLRGTSVGRVFIDPSQLDQVVSNLCVNARDAIDGAGTITIATESVELGADEAGRGPGLPPGPYLRLSISDTGAGIPPEQLQHIFEPFFTSKPVGEGTGLGLSTVDGAVRQNGGLVEVSSVEGQGTTFQVWLPRHERATSMDPVARPQPSAVLGQASVLVVEDEPAILRLADRLLSRAGYQVRSASGAAEARAIAARQPFDLLLTDVILPSVNGRELARELQRLQPDLRVLFMSGYTADVMERSDVFADGVHFLEKPFAVDDLLGAMQRALGGSDTNLPPWEA